ncbi:unnamed protein product [Brassica oleracea]
MRSFICRSMSLSTPSTDRKALGSSQFRWGSKPLLLD